MSDVDYRNASIATGIPVDTLKQFFKENDRNAKCDFILYGSSYRKIKIIS